ncbi:MAG: zinc-ribbon and DUF3426 domain-containing protein [Methylococcaceae bacterium]
MFTRCPNCQKLQSVTVEQLRSSRAIVFCRHCSINYDALELLSEAALDNTEQRPSTEPLPWEKSHSATTNSNYWQPGVFLCLLLLIGQIVYFEGYSISQHIKFRPVLEKVCQQIYCQLPAYKNLHDIAVLHSSFTPLPDRNYKLNAVISNQSPFRQNYPIIDLTLLDFTGQAFTHRLFTPAEYLSETAITEPMPTDAEIALSLKIAATQISIGGYTLELTY